jgi:hypothetical protein
MRLVSGFWTLLSCADYPVKVFKAGPVELTYSFLGDEGTKTKGTLKLDFLEVTPL